MAAIEIQGLSKRFGSVRAVSRPLLRGPGGPRDRLPRPQRRRQEHDDPDAAGPGPSRRRHRGRSTAPRTGTSSIPSAHVGAVLEDASFHPGRTGRNHLRILAAAGDHPRAAGRGGPGADRDRRRRQPARQGLLDGDAPAARDRGGAAGRPRGADPGRAGERPRPSRHPLDARPAALRGGEGPGGPGLEPPALRGLPDRRRRRRDLEGRAPRQRPDRRGRRGRRGGRDSRRAPPTRRGSPLPWTRPGSRTATIRRGRCSSAARPARPSARPPTRSASPSPS